MEMVHVMTRHPETIPPDETLAKAEEMMDVAGFRRLPVVKDGKIVGDAYRAQPARTLWLFELHKGQRRDEHPRRISWTELDGSGGHTADATA
jgi:CBS-domain-containing membrane protein